MLAFIGPFCPNSRRITLIAPIFILLDNGKSIMSDILDLRSSLSDFNSCLESEEASSLSEDEVASLEKEQVNTTATMNEKKRQKKRKRK